MTAHSHTPQPHAFPALWADGSDPDATRAALLFAASHLPRPSFQKLSAVFYLADRLHLERYGALMLGGHYEAMRDGPAPSSVYGLLRAAQHTPEDARAHGFRVYALEGEGPAVLPLTAPDMDELSDSIVECLTAMMDAHGGKDAPTLSALTQDQAWRTCPPFEAMTAAHLAATLPNARAVLEHLADPHPG